MSAFAIRVQQSQVFFPLQIQRCALLAAIEPYEIRRHSLYGRIVMARGLAFRSLDLDDARARVGKANGAEAAATACSIETTSSPASEPPRESSRRSDLPLNSGARDDPGPQPLVRAAAEIEPPRVYDIEKACPVVVEVALSNLRADTPRHVGDKRFNDVETAISEQAVMHGSKHRMDIAVSAVRRICVS
jgi:hypothetical protein